MKTRKTKTPHIQPDAVIKAALEILDAEGLENVTLRRIAAKLNVQAPALYWHFKDKSDITDDMAQAILKNAKLRQHHPTRGHKQLGHMASRSNASAYETH